MCLDLFIQAFYCYWSCECHWPLRSGVKVYMQGIYAKVIHPTCPNLKYSEKVRDTLHNLQHHHCTLLREEGWESLSLTFFLHKQFVFIFCRHVAVVCGGLAVRARVCTCWMLMVCFGQWPWKLLDLIWKVTCKGFISSGQARISTLPRAVSAMKNCQPWSCTSIHRAY